MERDEVRLKILGAPNSIDVRALHRSLGGLIDLLHGSTESHWLISDLKVSSALVKLRPAMPSDVDWEGAFQEILAGLHHLESESSTPSSWGNTMVEALLQAGGLGKFAGVEGVELTLGTDAPIRIDGEIVANASRALKPPNTSLGSVAGKIDRYISRSGKKNFGLVDEATGKSVSVTFSASMEPRVVEAINKQILAWGLLRRDHTGRKVSLSLEDFELVESARGPVSLDDIVGVLGQDWTDGRSSVDWVREQRDQD
ncbi:hypothetical protein LRQ04_00155 [Paenarthrobacter sp. AR 02]|uniref:hypothetical protein n=1 Tax=Paenarthrobacter sp. AR 02 TaxID=2899821 RepID=UPI001F26AF2F|nr:hypothetical protein [Paenarthrobacter sp. AR 02]MCF3137654.1 hypothetical protein [Paenarthrobacter sp. AR 02]